MIKKIYFRHQIYKMVIKKFNIIIIAFLCSMSFFTIAFAIPKSPSVLSLANLVQIALQNNRDLKVAETNIAIAQGKWVQARLVPNPTLDLSDASDAPFNDEGEYTKSVGVTQSFPVAGRISRQIAVAKADVAMAKAELRNLKLKLAQQVASAYYSLVIVDYRLQQVQHILTINQELAATAKARLKVAEVSELDANTAELEYLRFLQQKELLQIQKTKILTELNLLLGRPANTALTVQEQFPLLIKLPTLTAMQQFALQNRPDLQIVWFAINRANANLMLAKANRFSDWTAGVAITQERQFVDGLGPQPSDKLIGVSLSVPLPLFNKNQGQILETISSSRQAYSQLHASMLQILNEVANNYNQVQSLEIIVRQYQAKLLLLGTNNVALAKSAYQFGQVSVFDVVQVERQQNDVQMAYLTTLEDYCQAWVKLQTAIGQYDLY